MRRMFEERLTGFDGEAGRGFTIGDLSDLQEFAQRSLAGLDPATPTGRSPVKFIGAAAVAEDIANLKAATAKTDTIEVFMTAASPGVISIYLQNEYYPTRRLILRLLGAQCVRNMKLSAMLVSSSRLMPRSRNGAARGRRRANC